MINVAIVGTGNICPKHIEAYLQFPQQCKIVALVDIYPEKAREKAQRYNLDCDVYDDHHAILDRDDIDLVDVCTPPYVHTQISVNALNHGKHVICEKPMAASLEECDQMLEAARRSRKVLSSIAQNRFRTPIANLKRLLDSGIAGEVKHVEVDSFWWRGHCYYDLWWRGLWEKEGGGCTLNHAVHHIDMLGWMMGLPQSVTAVMSNVAHDNAEVEDLSISVFRYPHALAQVTASVVHHGERQQLVFQCEKARISAPFSVDAAVSKSNGFPEKNEALEKAITACYDGYEEVAYTAHVGQIHDVLQAIAQGVAPAVTGEDGRRTIELITGIYESGSLGKTVRFPLQRDDPFYTVQGIMAAAPHYYQKQTSVTNFANEEITTGSDYGK